MASCRLWLGLFRSRSVDEEFGKKVAWDEPMLSGYQHTVLNCEKGEPLSSWGSLTGKGVKELIDKIKPDAVLLVGLNYRYDLVAYIEARRRRHTGMVAL